MPRIAGVLHIDRRAYPRHPIKLRVLYVLGGCVLDAQTIDVSEQGMCLQTEVEVEKGTQIRIYFTSRDDVVTRTIEAEVMWSRPLGGGQDEYQCGLRFREIAAEALAELKILMRALAAGQVEADLPEASADDIIDVVAPKAKNLPPPLETSLTFALSSDKRQHAERLQLGQSSLRQGQQAVARGDLDAALALLEEATRDMPHSAEAMEELAQVVYLRGDVVLAATLFDRALRLKHEGG